MFEQLSDKILGSLKKLRGQARISEDNIQEALKEIRLSLLEADVNFKVVKAFIDRIKEKAVGAEVLKGLDPGQQFVKIVHEELIRVLGGEEVGLSCRQSPSLLMLVGLQGAGKTTTAAKLALFVRKKLGKKPGLIPADIYRPAAIEQLKQLGQRNDVMVFDTQLDQKPNEILRQSLKWAADNMIDVLILDTAGRLQIDEPLMQELAGLKAIMNPEEILLVADAMLGQQSVNVAEGFHKTLGLTGLVLTKIDGDARGGAALSIRESTGVPIKFLGVGESASQLEVFHPDRLASRILDMGDVLSLVERVQETVDQEKAASSAKKMMKGQFTVEDFLEQMQQIKKLGSLESILKMLPGAGQMMKQIKDMAPAENEMKKVEAIIQSMTREERNNHEILNGSRRLRIAKGSGTEVKDVNRFIKQFEQSKKMMSQMMKMGMGRGGMPGPFGGGLGRGKGFP